MPHDVLLGNNNIDTVHLLFPIFFLATVSNNIAEDALEPPPHAVDGHCHRRWLLHVDKALPHVIITVVQQQLSTPYDVEFNGLRGGNRLRPGEVLSPTVIAIADDISYARKQHRGTRSYNVLVDTFLDTRERWAMTHYVSFPISIIHIIITDMTRQVWKRLTKRLKLKF